MKVRIKKNKVSVVYKSSDGYRVRAIYFNPINWLKNFIWIQIDEAFRRYEKNSINK